MQEVPTRMREKEFNNVEQIDGEKQVRKIKRQAQKDGKKPILCNN